LVRKESRRALALTITKSSSTATKLASTSSDPDVLAQEIVEDLEAALEQFREIATDLGDKRE
jgi:hypothetical protein